MVKILLLMSLLSLFGCGQNEPNGDRTVQSVYFSGTHGYHAYSNIGYRAERMEDGRTRVIVEVGNDRDRVFETDGSLMDTLDSLVWKYRMDRYKGHYQPKMEILDGDSWSMEITFTDGSYSSCGGYMAYPPGKGAEAIGKVEGTLSGWLYQEPAEDVALIAFHYEWHDEEGSEAYDWTREDGNADLSKRLANIIRWNHMGSYTGENLNEEDTSRPRWTLRVEYENGQKIETMDYLDRPADHWRLGVPSFSEMGLRSDTERLFSEVSQK